jgi:murein DD-endopeptidase MepM/ murein hydrolase activator NlpD
MKTPPHLLVVILLTPWASDYAAPPSSNPQAQRNQTYAGLPNLADFQTNRSDRFLVDLQYVSAGHPFKGRRAQQPHQGAHIHSDNSTNDWPKGGSAVSNYPAIYAVADGYVDRVDYSFKVGTNDRYGVSIAFAKEKGTVYSFCYGIEPMIPEPAPDFYRRYMLVSEGHRVKKGDILAYMYLPPGARGGSHIHFHIQAHNGGAFLAPAIFTDELVGSFHSRWNGFGRDGATSIPACMGYLLEAEENPFRTGAVDVLN